MQMTSAQRVFFVGVALALVPPTAPVGAARAAPADGEVYEKEVRPLLARHCLKCHGGEKPKSGVNLSAFPDEASALKSRTLWQKVWRALHAREMPPEEKRQSTAAERERITD